MQFDIETILKEYKPLQSEQARAFDRLLEKSDFANAPDCLGIIGLGGTISSGYSYAQETILAGPYNPAGTLLKSINDMFASHPYQHTALDFFAKDSRDIENGDMSDFLSLVQYLKNSRILITCGTYGLPLIAELLERSGAAAGKVVGLTGSMLPQGFTHSDAPGNILCTLSAMDIAAKTLKSCVLVGFHGKTYMGLDAFRAMDLHPENTKNLVLVAPQANTPIERISGHD